MVDYKRLKSTRFARSVGGQFVIATLVVLLLFWLVGAGASYALEGIFRGNWFVF
ncbi:hypothetical protein ACFY93_09795 [Streptomyces sp. NPDC008313]|uniref:hypothetical protein n=1 Tax=Streptomyces sp. NPDC008313 TaxID=3364826 RepID=UPI0036EE6348